MLANRWLSCPNICKLHCKALQTQRLKETQAPLPTPPALVARWFAHSPLQLKVTVVTLHASTTSKDHQRSIFFLPGLMLRNESGLVCTMNTSICTYNYNQLHTCTVYSVLYHLDIYFIIFHMCLSRSGPGRTSRPNHHGTCKFRRDNLRDCCSSMDKPIKIIKEFEKLKQRC